jgi:hypothetical protein
MDSVFLLFWLHAQIYDVMAVASGHIEADGPETIDMMIMYMPLRPSDITVEAVMHMRACRLHFCEDTEATKLGWFDSWQAHIDYFIINIIQKELA